MSLVLSLLALSLSKCRRIVECVALSLSKGSAKADAVGGFLRFTVCQLGRGCLSFPTRIAKDPFGIAFRGLELSNRCSRTFRNQTVSPYFLESVGSVFTATRLRCLILSVKGVLRHWGGGDQRPDLQSGPDW